MIETVRYRTRLTGLLFFYFTLNRKAVAELFKI